MFLRFVKKQFISLEVRIKDPRLSEGIPTGKPGAIKFVSAQDFALLC
jgi:hypothetical protein